MPIIPRRLNPEEDEILYSYLQRTAQANGIRNFAHFIADYLRPNDDLSTHKAAVMYDANTVYYGILRHLPDYVDPVDFYLKHSIYPCIAPLRTDAQQTHIVNQAFGRQEQFPGLITKITSMVPELRICPECMREDIEKNGFWYYHKAHQLPGVKTCWKHHVGLQKYHGIKNHEMDSKAVFEEITDIGDSDYGFASFVHDFCECNYQTNIKGTASAIFRKIRDLGYTTATYNEFAADVVISKGLRHLFSHDIPRILKIDLISPIYLHDPDVLALLYAIFDDASDVSKYLNENDNQEAFDKACEDKYCVEGTYRRTIINLCNTSTKHTFVTTPAGFIAGWKDPADDAGKNDSDKFKELFDIAADGKYECLTSFLGMNSKITVKHLFCHNVTDTFTTTPRSFLEEGVRCRCENIISFSEAAEKVKARGDYELINFVSTERLCEIRHLACGKTFTVKYRDFVDSPYCRAEWGKTRTHKQFVQEIQNLTGTEYQVIGKYRDRDTKVSIRHSVCGHTEQYLPRHFLDGERCNYCSREIPNAAFPKMVAASTYGRYQITGRPTSNLYNITDTETGTTKHLSKQKIIQEINRPTESPILPCPKRKKLEIPQNVTDRLITYLKTHYGQDDFIFLEDIKLQNDDGSYQQPAIIKNRIRELVESGIVIRVIPGIYVWPGKEYTTDELIEARYILRNGQRIGYYNGNSLAYQLGIITDKPETLYVASLKEASLHGRKITVLGRQIHIKQCEATITDKNYQVLQAVDIVHQAHHYGWDYRKPLLAFLESNKIQRHDLDAYLSGPKDEKYKKMLDVMYESEMDARV